MNDTIAGFNINRYNVGAINFHATLGGDGDILTFDRSNFSSHNISRHNLAGDYMVGKDFDEQILILWQQQLVYETSW